MQSLWCQGVSNSQEYTNKGRYLKRFDAELRVVDLQGRRYDLPDRSPQVGAEIEDKFPSVFFFFIREITVVQFCYRQYSHQTSLHENLLSPATSRSTMLPMRITKDPKNPWLFFLNFLWSKT